MLVFSKEKMLNRLKDADLLGVVTPATEKIMSMLDGLEVFPNKWRQTVDGEETAGYCVLEGKQYSINLLDCVSK